MQNGPSGTRPTMTYSSALRALALGVLTISVVLPGPAYASGYDRPPREILEVMRAPAAPVPRVSPTKDSMLLISWQQYPSIARVSEPFLRLAGARVEPRNRSKHDTPGGYGISPGAQSYTLVRIPSGEELPVQLPKKATIGAPLWSADGKYFAFTAATHNAVELWIGDSAHGAVRKVPGVRLNPMLDAAIQWMPDQKTLLVKAVPDHQGPPPPSPDVPDGPSIQESTGKKGQSSTYENRDTLGSAHDEDLFDYYAASQLALVDTTRGTVTPVGKPANYVNLDAAPDGKHVLVSSVHRPYSYVTTYERFPQEIQVWDVSRPAKIGIHTMASLPLADRVPVHGVPVGPRDFSWRATEPTTLIWAEALDGGDWNVTVPARDKVMMQRAPFETAPTEVMKVEQRFGGFSWGERPETALLDQYDENRHWQKTLIVDVDHPKNQRLLWDQSMDEMYKNPGTPVYRRLANGAVVMQQDGGSIFLSGNGATPQGDRPFLDRLDLATLETKRLFRSEKGAYERFLALTDAHGGAFLTWRQTPQDPPNAFAHRLGKPITSAVGEAAYDLTSAAVTHVTDPSPQLRKIKKRLVTYKRADGLDLSFTLYTPPGYLEGTRIPAILNAYPLDYADPAAAGQITGSQQTFTQLRQYQLLLLAGYAVIDKAAFPIVGDPKSAYDTYLDQLVADAQAAVKAAVDTGVVDPDRIAVTGHSHGALMTANLLAHTDLFRAGAATSGSYNKTLTPFGFQNERRSVWEAPEVYRKASTFFFADKLKKPILIVHGADDANPGTTPLQATKFFEAIRGNGGIARLVMLPHEPHWYAAQESNEHLVAELLRWFDKYVKNAPARSPGN